MQMCAAPPDCSSTVQAAGTHVLLDELLQEEGDERLQRLGHEAVVHL